MRPDPSKLVQAVRVPLLYDLIHALRRGGPHELIERLLHTSRQVGDDELRKLAAEELERWERADVADGAA